MFLLCTLLFWLPLLGPLIAGFVGGRMAVNPGRAVLASLIPSLILAVAAGTILSLFHLPVIGALTGIAVLVVAIVHSIPIMVGAALGAATV